MPEETKEPKRLYLSKKHRIFAGVAGGIGEYFDIDPVLVRVAFVVLTLLDGLGLILYVILMIAVPEAPGGESVAKKESAGEFVRGVGDKVKEGAEEIRKKNWGSASGRDFIGAIIILLGLALLLNQLLPRFGIDWDVFWPLILILLGIYVLLKRR